MFHYVEDKEFLRKMRTTCSDLVNHLVQEINRDDSMRVRAYLVGNGAKNLIMQNEKEPVDVDYNLEVIEAKNLKNKSQMKDYNREMFNKVLRAKGWRDCSDSTSCLSTKNVHFQTGNPTKFSIDLAIVRKNPDGVWARLIHHKTGHKETDRWIWNEAPNSRGLSKKAARLKKNNYWLEVRECYKRKKNMYLTRGDGNHPSFICYIEAVNEIYAKFNLD